MKKTLDFTQGRIFAPLIKFSLPVLLALLLQAMYGAVDLLIVGQFGGEMAEVYVSAVSTGSQIMHSLTFVITALAMGLTVSVAEKIGARELDDAGKVIGSGICLFAVVAAVLTAVMLVFASDLAEIMRAPDEALFDTVLYISICSGGLFTIVAYNLLGSIFRGIGDSKMPLITVAIACVLNIFGDLLLVAVFGLGAAGAALATVFAQMASVILSLIIIKRRTLPFAFSVKDIRPVGRHIKRILRLGIPIAFQEFLVSLSFLVILAIVNDIGLTESAGIGVAEKVCAFIMLLPAAFMQSMSAFVAQNMGAMKPERAKKALWCGIAASLAAGVVMGYVTFFHGNILAAIFTDESGIIKPAFDYLRAYAIDCLFTAFLFCFIGYFNGCGSTAFVMCQGIIGALGVRVPVSWLMSGIEPVSLFLIGLATPCSTLTQIAMCVVFFFITERRRKQRAPKLM